MIMYFIKLILILVFNTCVNIYYINSECKCCCNNNKSGEIGSGSKTNLDTNPPLGPNPPKGPETQVKTHTSVKPPEEVNQILDLNQPKGNKPIVGGEGSKSNLGTNPIKYTNPSITTHTAVKPPEEVKPILDLNQPKGNKPIIGGEGSKSNLGTNPIKYTNPPVKTQIKDFLNIEININDASIQVTNVNKETKNFTKISEKTPTINNITYGIYSSITNLYEFDEEIFNCITNDSEITITGVELPSYILFAVLTESNEYYLGLCKNGVSQTDNVEKRGIFEGMEGNYNIKILGIGDSLDSFFAMFYRSKIKNVTFVKSVNTQKVKNMMYMFDGCKSLKELNLSNFNTSNVTNMDCMFKDCSSLTSLSLPDKVIYYGETSDMFNGCDKLSKTNVRTKDINILNMILKK